LTGALERRNVICHGARLFSFPVGGKGMLEEAGAEPEAQCSGSSAGLILRDLGRRVNEAGGRETGERAWFGIGSGFTQCGLTRKEGRD
jgi:hypothetical protein